MNAIIHGDALDELKGLAEDTIDLVYIDPPFGLQKKQKMTRIKASKDPSGDRVGFQDLRYRTKKLGTYSYNDIHDDYITWLAPFIHEIYRILKPDGSFFLHLDYRNAHYAKVLTDLIFGRASFMNNLVWIYDFGGRAKKKWSAKHDDILWYVVDPKNYKFNYDDIDRIPYLAPGLVGKEKAKKGKIPTDSWWNTIVPTNSKDRTGYPTQKPVQILKRIIAAHTNSTDLVLDCFAGSGTTGEAAGELGREFIMIDNNLDAIKIMRDRLEEYKPLLD
jgi:site-specific DNA-methyltransferase (adenine-specific)